MSTTAIKKSLATVLMGLSIGFVFSPVQAEYQDAIAMPAIKMASAQFSLTLDIDRAGERLVAVGERGHVMVSDDQGLSWTQANIPSRMQLNATVFVDANTGWAVGEDQLIVKTDDGGENWQLQHEGSRAEQKGPLLDLLFTDTDNGFAVGVFNTLLRTRDGGATWQNWQEHIDNLDEWHLISMAATGRNSDTLYIASEMGLLFRSTDGGDSFEPLQTDHDGSFHGILARRSAEGLDQLVLLGVGGILYNSLDGGDSWNQLDTATEAGLAGATWLDDGSALIVGADGVVLRLDSSLKTLKKHHTDSGLPLSSAIALNDSEVMMVGFGGFHRFDLSR